MKKNIYKEAWYVIVTEENKDVLRKWRGCTYLSVGHICGMCKSYNGRLSKEHNPKNLIKKDGDYDFGEEITFEQFKKYVLKEENMVEEKDSRFPFTLKPEQAQSIIDIACGTWKDKLAKKWANRIVTKNYIQVDYVFYKVMRNACTTEQHKLFDKIFGKDTLECVFKQGEYIVYNDRTYHIETTDDGNGRVQLRNISFESGRTIRFVSIEDINKNAHLWSIDDTKNGEPVWCEDNITNWIFRYSNGKGEIYPCQKKSINDYYGGFIVYKPFDPFNLPYSEW